MSLAIALGSQRKRHIDLKTSQRAVALGHLDDVVLTPRNYTREDENPK